MTEKKNTKKTSTKKVKLVETEAEPMVVSGGEDEQDRLKPVERPAEASGTGAEASGTPEASGTGAEASGTGAEIGGTATAGTVEEPGKVTVRLTRWMGYLPPGAIIKMDKAAADKAVANGKGVIV